MTSIKRAEERNHHSNELELHKTDMQKSWKIMKSVIGKNKSTTKKVSYFMLNNIKIENNIRIANEFNNYFVSVGPTLASKVVYTNVNPLNYVPVNISSIVINNFIEHDVILVINTIKNSSPGWDGIPAAVSKQYLQLYLKPLTYFINQSFTNGIFPDEMKIAKVVPIYKSGSTMEFSNYRPISVLNCFSKIYEKLMYNRIIEFFDKYNILYQNQFGFRKGHSTHYDSHHPS